MLLSPIMEASSSSLRFNNSNLSNRLNDKACLSDSTHNVNELIANLDHELWDVRLRALKCILGKVECSIITTDYLSRRIDLLHRLSDWTRASLGAFEDERNSPTLSLSPPRGKSWSVNIAVAAEGIPCVLKLFYWLSEFESVKKFIVTEKLDSALSKLKPFADNESKILLEQLFSRLCTHSFEFTLEGSPDVWDDNTSIRKGTSTEKSYSYEDKGDDDDGVGDILIRRLDDKHRIPDINMSDHSAAGDTYFPNQSFPSYLDKSWASVFFGVPYISMSGNDRRVLASTIESLLSKNESLVLSTTCFFRDVLLQDYPPELFIQESALCMALLEVAESPWVDSNVPKTAAFALLQLSYLLRLRIAQLNSSEFYETKRAAFPPSQYGSGFSSYNNRSFSSASDNYITTLCQLLKGLSRTLLFHPKEFNLWRLMDGFSLTICKCAHTFPVDYKSLSLGLQEVLLDLAYCYEKHGNDINSTILALALSSLLKSLQNNSEMFILAYDVRQCIRKLCRCPLLVNSWPEVHQYLIQHASPLVDSLNSSDPVVDLSGNMTAYGDSSQISELHPREAISKLLIAVQNATSHQSVMQAIENIWGFVMPLTINTRTNTDIMDHLSTNAGWRDAFYRFLCVEPTCMDDEELLINVLDLMTFIYSNLKKEQLKLGEWIIPLCAENGCATLRLLNSNCTKSEIPYSGTILPNILQSLFNFYLTVMKSSSSISSHAEYKWNVFNTLCIIFHQLGNNGFTYSAVLHPILKGIALLSSTKEIRNQLLQNPKFCVALIHRITECIISLQERSGGLSNESYRNQGTLYYCSLSLHHNIGIVVAADNNNNYKKTIAATDWIGPCCAVIPCMWESSDARVKAVGFQLCQIMSRSIPGIIALITILESETTIWTTCYNSLMDFEQPAIVKQFAASTICNLLSSWDEVIKTTGMGKSLDLPFWPVFDDITKLLSNVFWYSSMSEVFGNVTTGEGNAFQTDEDSSNVQLVTPKLLTMICKLLMEMKNSSIPQFHPEFYISAISSSGLCPALFRIVGTHNVTPKLQPPWWIDCIYALSSVVEALISLCHLDRGFSLMLIGDKRSIISLIQLLTIQSVPSANSQVPEDEGLSTLWINVLTLLTIICADSGNNFEEVERCISNQRNIIFSKLINWLNLEALAKCRKIALNFTRQLLCRLNIKQQETDASENSIDKTSMGHPMLCREWKNHGGTYGSELCKNLLSVYEESSNSDERQTVLRTLSSLVNSSPTAKEFAIQNNALGIVLQKLKDFGVKYSDMTDSILLGKKSNYQWLDESHCILSLISSLVYNHAEGKKSALTNGIINACHKIFKWWKIFPDRTMLHTFIEVLLNFTEEFPAGCQALTQTNNILGVGPRKVSSVQSLLFETIEILQGEMRSAESCNLRTLELVLEFLKNATFVIECRNILLKSLVLQFLTNLHVRDMKKWGLKQHRIKLLYLDFLLQISVHPDIQAAIAKVPDSIEILVQLTNVEDQLTALFAIKILRNLSFLPANRTRILCEDTVMACLSTKIRGSENLEEVECAAVGLWALVSNSEKGKLVAKKSQCPASVMRAVARLRKLEQSSNDLLSEKQDLSNLINILTTLSNILGCTLTHQSQSLSSE